MPVKTFIFPEKRLPGVYNSINKYVNQGRQVYYILPLIEESEKIDLKSAQAVYQKLKNEIFPNLTIELMHGKLKQEQKDNIMQKFKQGIIHILVSTTVIEVGIDVANASVIIIEHAERFGLAQLHQLRGRVGRGEHQSYCVLVHPDKISQAALERIKIIEQTNDGFAISEHDLKQRGAGELIGSRQHGNHEFEFTDLVNDIDIITIARTEAANVIENYHEDIDEIFKQLHNKNYSIFLQDIRKKRILAILS